MRDVDRLTACLADLDWSGWNLGEYVAARPELPDSIRVSLVAAGRVQILPRPTPSEAFRARSRAHLVTFIQNEALLAPTRTHQARIRRAIDSLFRAILAPVAAALLILGGSAGVWSASAGALPGTPLYGAKIGIERIQLLTAFTPAQQVSVHLSIASARLQEADAETWAGNRAVSDTLLHDYDGEIAKAQSILLIQASAPGSDSLLAQSDWELVMLQEERQRLIASTLAPVAPALTSNALPSTVNLVVAKPTVSPADPSKLQQTQANIGLGVTGALDTSANTAQAPGIVSVSGGVGVAGVAVGQSDVAKDSSNAVSVSVTDRLDRLVGVLLAQASAGDDSAAGTTAQEFALDVKSGQASGTLSIDRLMLYRSRLEAALGVAPASTQGALQVALNAIYDVVPGSRPVSTTAGGSAPAAPAATGSSGPVTVAPVVNPTPVTAAPKKADPVQTPTGQQHSGGIGQRPVPVITAPQLPSPFIKKPIIVRDPSHLPSPALTGRKPLTIAKKQPLHIKVTEAG